MTHNTVGVRDGLAEPLSGTLLLPGDPGYDAARRVHNGQVDGPGARGVTVGATGSSSSSGATTRTTLFRRNHNIDPGR